MIIKRILFIMSVLFNIVIFSGFPAQTVIKAGDDYAFIEHIKIGDMVECYNDQNDYVKKEIIYKKVHKESSCICVVLDGEECMASCFQKFYIADQKIWKMAKDLVPGDLLLGEARLPIPVKEIIVVEEEIELYDIAVQECHNFLVLKQGILVHNFFPAIAVGASWAFGAGGVKFLGATLGVGALKIGICGLAQLFRNRRGRNEEKHHFEAVLEEKNRQGSDSHRNITPPDANVTFSMHAQQSLALDSEKVVSSSIATVGVEAAATYFAKKIQKQRCSNVVDSKGKDDACAGKKKNKCPFHETCSQVHPHGLYDDAGYHHQNSKGRKSPAPIDGQWALDFSVIIGKKDWSKRRIGVSCGQIVILAPTAPLLWHGHVRAWDDLDEDMKTAAKSQGWANKRGKIKCASREPVGSGYER